MSAGRVGKLALAASASDWQDRVDCAESCEAALICLIAAAWSITWIPASDRRAWKLALAVSASDWLGRLRECVESYEAPLTCDFADIS